MSNSRFLSLPQSASKKNSHCNTFEFLTGIYFQDFVSSSSKIRPMCKSRSIFSYKSCYRPTKQFVGIAPHIFGIQKISRKMEDYISKKKEMQDFPPLVMIVTLFPTQEKKDRIVNCSSTSNQPSYYFSGHCQLDFHFSLEGHFQLDFHFSLEGGVGSA